MLYTSGGITTKLRLETSGLRDSDLIILRLYRGSREWGRLLIGYTHFSVFFKNTCYNVDMKNTVFLVTLLSLVACTNASPATSNSKSIITEGEAVVLSDIQNQPEKFTPYYTVSTTTNRYRGNWFDIDVPAGFIARPTDSIVPDELVYNTDEAFFTSPDASVEFYIYSPQWSGEPSYTSVADDEVMVDTTSKEEQKDTGLTRTTWTTVKAKDNSYERSFVSIRSQIDTGSEVHHVFGIRYKTKADYDRFKADYEAFKNSLVQYAD
jgi:hypothetical protein